MKTAELLKVINEGKNSYVEFKRDDVQADSVAKEMSALLNLEGGLILLGVEDDGSVTGYVEHLGMGVRNSIIRPMVEHNGKAPDLVEDGERFVVRLWE